MPMYNLIEYSNNYSKISGSLWKYYKDKPNDNLADSKSFKSKIKIIGNIPADSNTKNFEIIVSFKYLRNFWRALEMPLIKYEVNLILTWSSTCFVTNSTGAGRFGITETKVYASIVTLSTQDNTKLLQQLKLVCFKRTINWNIYQSDPKTYAQNRYLNHLNFPSFQGVNRLFLLSFENENDRTSHSDSNNSFKTYGNIRKLQLIKETITQLVIHISKKIRK